MINLKEIIFSLGVSPIKNILYELYAGNISPWEQYFPESDEYRKLCKKHIQHHSDFIDILKKLDPPLHKQFIKIIDELSETTPYEFSEMFMGGFRLGVRIMIDVFHEELYQGKGSFTPSVG